MVIMWVINKDSEEQSQTINSLCCTLYSSDVMLHCMWWNNELYSSFLQILHMHRTKVKQCWTESRSELYLVPPEVVDYHHAGEVQHHAQTLKGGHSEPQSTILLNQAGCVITAVRAALAAWQAFIWHVRDLVSVRDLPFTWGHENTNIYYRVVKVTDWF